MWNRTLGTIYTSLLEQLLCRNHREERPNEDLECKFVYRLPFGLASVNQLSLVHLLTASRDTE